MSPREQTLLDAASLYLLATDAAAALAPMQATRLRSRLLEAIAAYHDDPETARRRHEAQVLGLDQAHEAQVLGLNQSDDTIGFR